MFRTCELSKPEAFRNTFENPMAKGNVNACAKANTNGQVPVDLSRMMVIVSMLQPLVAR
jgi:hypothetical protein